MISVTPPSSSTGPSSACPAVRATAPIRAEFETGNLTLSVMAARAELEARGVTFVGGIDSGVCHQAYFSDPDGTPLVLHQRDAPRF